VNADREKRSYELKTVMNEERYVLLDFKLPSTLAAQSCRQFQFFDDGNHRGVWQTKPGAKGQSRLSASKKLNSGPPDKKESQTSSRAGAGRGQSTGRDQVNQWQGADTTQGLETSSLPPTEQHTPASSFNSKDVKASMESKIEPQPAIYKSTPRPLAGRPGQAPWGSRCALFHVLERGIN
jgi:hypothetical protein